MASALLLTLPGLILLQAQPTFYAAWEDGRDAERRNRFEAALAAYERAAALRPRSAGQVIIYGNNVLQNYYPYTRIARCCLELSRWDAAGKALAQAEREKEPQEERQALGMRLKNALPREPAPPVAAPPVPVPAPALAPAPAVLTAPLTSAVPPPAPAVAPPRAPEPSTSPKAMPEARRLPAAGPLPVPLPAPPAPTPAPVPKPLPAQGREGLRFGLLGALVLGAAGLWAFGRRRRPALDQAFHQPERLGPYRLERLLGRGGFASTYLARKDGEQRPVALKLLHPFRQDDPEFLGRFRQEAHLGSLLDHPNIVRLLDQGPQDDTPWLVMEYVEGQRLDLLLKDKGRLPWPQVADLGRQVASAMAYAHARGIIHRDLKPGNILIVGTQAKVMDFGIARVMDAATLTTTYAFLGTPYYAAPELQLKTQVGPAADRYSLGILLFELLTGHPPFEGETPFAILDQHRQADFPDLAGLCPDAPKELVELIGQLTRKEPGERPEDQALLARLERI